MDVSFWRWLIFGSGGKAGYKNFFGIWLFLHLSASIFLALFAKDPLIDVSSRLLLPLAGILVGMSFAMTSSFHSIMDTKEIEELSQYNPGGYQDYLYTFQLSFFVLFLTLAAWGIAGIGLFDQYLLDGNRFIAYEIVKAVLYFLFSLSLRESWQVIVGTHSLILVRKKISEKEAR